MKNIKYAIGFFLILHTFSCINKKREVVNANDFFSSSDSIVQIYNNLLLERYTRRISGVNTEFPKIIRCKYYKNDAKNSIVGCALTDTVNDRFLIFELRHFQKTTHISSFVAFHSNSNCWTDEFLNFKRHFDYYSFELSATGSGYCSTTLYLFKDVFENNNIEKMTKLLIREESFSEVGNHTLNSEIIFKKDTLIVFYEKNNYSNLESYLNNEVTKTKNWKHILISKK